jgi:phage tail-like protein
MAGIKYPPVGFYFKVTVLPFVGEAGFQSVDGLSVEIPEYSYKEGGVNLFTHRLPDRISYKDLTLKRGMVMGSALIQWFRAGVDNFTFIPTEVTVTLLNDKQQPLDMWIFHQAWPKAWNVEGFNAMDNKVAVETIVIAYQKFIRVGIPAQAPSVPSVLSPNSLIP